MLKMISLEFAIQVTWLSICKSSSFPERGDGEERETHTFSIGWIVEICRHPPEGKEMQKKTMMHSRVTREACLELWIGIKKKLKEGKRKSYAF